MKTYVFHALCVLAVLAMISPAQAELKYYEGFNYGANASIDGVGGWTCTNDIVGTSATGLTYTGLATEGGAAKYAQPYSVGYPAVAYKLLGSGVSDLFKSESGTFYMSMMIGDSTGGSGERAVMQLFRDTGAGTYAADGVEISTLGDPGDIVRRVYDIGAGEGSAPNVSGFNGTKLSVVKITMQAGDDVMAVVTNPNLATLVDGDFAAADKAYGDISAAAGENIDFLLLKFGFWDTPGPGQYSLIDEIRIGTELADVIPVPEPTTLMVLGLSLVPVLLRRRG